MPAFCRTHATSRLSLSLTSRGSLIRQSGFASWHLGWNRQPVGGLNGFGTSPGKSFGMNELPSACGIAEIRAFVYGWEGLFQIWSTVPISTIFPKYITATRSEILRTIDKSCETKIMPILNSSTNFTKRLAT